MNHKGIILISLLNELIHDGFLIEVQELNNNNNVEDKIELKGANIYPLSNRKDTFIVMPIFPPVFQEGLLRCPSTNRQLSWFINSDRNICLIDFHGKGLVLKDGEWVESKSPLFIPSIKACIGFLKWLESEHKRIEKEDALIQTMILINDQDTKGFPHWLIEIPFFMDKWVDYKAHYKNLYGEESP